MTKNKSLYMIVDIDKYELPCSPPYNKICDIAKAYNMKPDTVSKAIKRESKTRYGKFIKVERNIETMEEQLQLEIEELEEQIDNLEMRLSDAASGIRTLMNMLKSDKKNGSTCHPAFMLSKLADIENSLYGEIDYAKAIGL